MLRPVRMCVLDSIVPTTYKTPLVEALHKQGISQIEFFADDELKKVELERDVPLERVNDVSLLLMRTRKIVDILSVFDKTKVSMLEEFLGVGASGCGCRRWRGT